MLTDVGLVEVKVPRDTSATFERQIVKNRQRRLTGVDEMEFSLSVKGAHARRDIRAFLRHPTTGPTPSIAGLPRPHGRHQHNQLKDATGLHRTTVTRRLAKLVGDWPRPRTRRHALPPPSCRPFTPATRRPTPPNRPVPQAWETGSARARVYYQRYPAEPARHRPGRRCRPVHRATPRRALP
ncbi:transposase [Streptomyces scabiei]|uniref:transposase n=1 Tax=Streptomyces TaxID=1883 RepID=UPI0038D49F6A